MDSLNKYAIISLTSTKNQKLKEMLKKHLGKKQYLSLVRHGKILINEEKIEDFNIDVLNNTKVDIYFKRPKLKEKIKLIDFSDIDVLYENDHVLVINKNYNSLSIPSINNRNFKVVSEQVASYLGSKKFFEPIHIITRLDADTSGCMLFAKDSYSHSILSKQQEQGILTKEYQVICFGEEIKTNLIDAPISRDTESILKRRIDFENGKVSKTQILDVKRLESDFKLVTIKLLTGRTHQIRVHLKYINNDIVGDTLYSNNLFANRQYLHAHKICFKDIETNEDIKIIAPLKKDMSDFILKHTK